MRLKYEGLVIITLIASSIIGSSSASSTVVEPNSDFMLKLLLENPEGVGGRYLVVQEEKLLKAIVDSLPSGFYYGKGKVRYDAIRTKTDLSGPIGNTMLLTDIIEKSIEISQGEIPIGPLTPLELYGYYTGMPTTPPEIAASIGETMIDDKRKAEASLFDYRMRNYGFYRDPSGISSSAASTPWKIYDGISIPPSTSLVIEIPLRAPDKEGEYDINLNIPNLYTTTQIPHVSAWDGRHIAQDKTSLKITITVKRDNSVNMLDPSLDAETISSNLLLNPGAEASNTDGWQHTTEFYTTSRQNQTSGTVYPHEGDNFFSMARFEGSYGNAIQRISISEYTSEIDKGIAYINAGIWIQNEYLGDNPDSCKLTIQYLDSKEDVLKESTTDEKTHSDANYWKAINISEEIPANTRYLVYKLEGFLHFGSWLNCFFDDAYLYIMISGPKEEYGTNNEVETVSGSMGLDNGSQIHKVTQTPGSSTVIIFADAGCIDSGFKVSKGDSIEFSASGQPTYGYEGSPVNDCPATNPDGERFVNNISIGKKIDTNAICPSAPIGSLIGKVGTNGVYFFIGSHNQLTMQESGTIMLCYNDAIGTYNNNAGFFEVTIINLPET